MLSPRAQVYLNKLERIDFIDDISFLKSKLLEIGVGYPDSILEFQLTYGGFIEKVGLRENIFGIIHKNPKYLTPNTIDFEKEDQDESPILLHAADTHLVHGIMIDELGWYYYNWLPNAESFDLKFERDAFYAEMSAEQKLSPIRLVKEDKAIEHELFELFQEHEIQALSDQFARLYTIPGGLLINRFGLSKNNDPQKVEEGFFPEFYLSTENQPEAFKHIKYNFL